MNSTTRILCQKYTDLTDREIDCLEQYNALIPALANAEEADVFVDCRTTSGRTAIVVCEAKPQTVSSNYEGVILGMLIPWQNEPAVARSFRLGLPSKGIRAVSMPENRQIVQTVEPIFFEGRLIGTLIYEKATAPPAEALEAPRDEPSAETHIDCAEIADYLDDALIFLDQTDRVCWYNQEAAALYARMGYVSGLMGAAASNIQPLPAESLSAQFHESTMANRVLQSRCIPLGSERVKCALILRDVTEQRGLEKELAGQQTAAHELRHRIKNNLSMLADLLQSSAPRLESVEEAQTAMTDMAARLLSIVSTLDGVVQRSRTRISLLCVLEQIRRYTLQTLLAPTRSIAIQVTGDPVEVSADCATSVALVVNELIQNALKYAFPAERAGTIQITLRERKPFYLISVSDDGVGFGQRTRSPESMGLSLAQRIVEDKLLGEWRLETGETGTTAAFDFLDEP